VTPYATVVPAGVTEYSSTHDFIADGPGTTSRFHIAGDVGGWDAIARVNHSDGSEWRVSIIRGVVYAVLRRYPGDNRYTFDGPVWEIASLPEGYMIGDHHLVDRGAIRFFQELEASSRRQEDGLRND
jgi:hypothetical protein